MRVLWYDSGMSTEFVRIVCPACYETFEVAAPSPGEVPAEVDYDCEICCRPMVIAFWQEEGEILAEARSLDD